MKRSIGKNEFEAVVIGCSAGGTAVLSEILPALHESFPLPVMIVQHISAAADDLLVRLLRESCRIAVKEAEDGEDIQPEVVYLAPANYHLLVEKDRTLSLSVDKEVNYSRPSIDVLFETAARSFGEKLVGVLLTGANKDGSLGLKTIREYGGLVVVQDPATAEAPIMPLAAIETTEADYILTIQKIADLLERLGDGE